jgi:DNA-binding CsgD family transcriptional regulator
MPLSILITPLHPANSPFCSIDSRASAAVFISDPHHQRQIPSDVLCCLYGLTKAEARLATELAQGNSLIEIGETYHLSQNTLRSHLKSIFRKTGLKSQSDLVRIILSGPAIIQQFSEI